MARSTLGGMRRSIVERAVIASPGPPTTSPAPWRVEAAIRGGHVVDAQIARRAVPLIGEHGSCCELEPGSQSTRREERAVPATTRTRLLSELGDGGHRDGSVARLGARNVPARDSDPALLRRRVALVRRAMRRRDQSASRTRRARDDQARRTLHAEDGPIASRAARSTDGVRSTGASNLSDRHD